jgi:hypothetical protein
VTRFPLDKVSGGKVDNGLQALVGPVWSVVASRTPTVRRLGEGDVYRLPALTASVCQRDANWKNAFAGRVTRHVVGAREGAHDYPPFHSHDTVVMLVHHNGTVRPRTPLQTSIRWSEKKVQPQLGSPWSFSGSVLFISPLSIWRSSYYPLLDSFSPLSFGGSDEGRDGHSMAGSLVVMRKKGWLGQNPVD